MSGIRRIKSNIPKNSNSCDGCKNYVLIGHEYGYEEDTNGYYKISPVYKCNYLGIVSSSETMEDYFHSSFITEEDLMDIDRRHDLLYGYKICDKYPHKPKRTGHWVKAKPKVVYIDVDIDDDDIPF